jgi:hypothetical protein
VTAYFSTQSSIEARISALRLKGWIDFDGDDAPDEASLTAAFEFARGLIRGHLESRYGQTEIDTWDSSTRPELVGTISDDLCIYQLLLSNPTLAEASQQLYTNAKDLLAGIASHVISLYGVTAPVDDEFLTERSPSDFDPERELDDMTTRTTWILPDSRELAGY